MDYNDNSGEWLDEVGDLCMKTLSQLNSKAERNSPVTRQDVVLRDVCLAYLYLMTICHNEGLLSEFLTNNITTNRTIH